MKILFLALACALPLAAAAAQEASSPPVPAGPVMLADFEADADAGGWSPEPRTHLALSFWHATSGRRSAKLTAPVSLGLSPTRGGFPEDWRGFAALHLEGYNPQSYEVRCALNVRGVRGGTFSQELCFPPGGPSPQRVDLAGAAAEIKERVLQVQIRLAATQKPDVLFLDRLLLLPEGSAPPPAATPVPLLRPENTGAAAFPTPTPLGPEMTPAPSGVAVVTPPPFTPRPTTAPVSPRPATSRPATPRPATPRPAAAALVLCDFEGERDPARWQLTSGQLSRAANAPLGGQASGLLTLDDFLEAASNGALLQGAGFPTNWSAHRDFVLELENGSPGPARLELHFLEGSRRMAIWPADPLTLAGNERRQIRIPLAELGFQNPGDIVGVRLKNKGLGRLFLKLDDMRLE